MPAYKKERKGGGRSKAGVKNKSPRGEKKKNYFQFEVISIQSSLSKLFTVKSYDSLQVGVSLAPTVLLTKSIMLTGSQQGRVC